MTGREARALERRFLRGVIERLRLLKTVYDPLKDTTLQVEYDEDNLITGNHKERIRRRMEEMEIFDRRRLDEIPHEAFVRYTAEQKGFLWRVGAVVIHAAVVTDIEPFIKGDDCDHPVDTALTEEVFMRVHKTSTGLYHYIGLFSPTGFSDETKEALPVRETAGLALIEKGENTRWDVWTPNVPWRGQFEKLFDVETERERRHRVRKALLHCSDLSYAGGHIEITQIAEQERVEFEIVKREAERLAKDEGDLLLEQIDGVWVLRRRFL